MRKSLLFNLYTNKSAIGVLIAVLYFLAGSGLILSQYKYSARETLDPSIRSKGMFILRVDDQGRLYDRQANEKELSSYLLAKTNNSQNFTIVHSLNKPELLTGLKILLRASNQLMANPQALIAFRRAAARWERVINTPMTVVIDVDYGPTRWGTAQWPTGVLGSTDASFYDMMVSATQPAGVADVVAALKSNHPNDPQLQALYNAIPDPAHTTSGIDFTQGLGGQVSLQVLGFLPADTNPDSIVNPFGSVPNIAFNSNFGFDLDPSDGISTGLYDFDGVCTHEMGHALGFLSVVDFQQNKNVFTPWDLFRVRPDAVAPGNLTQFNTAQRVNTPGPPPSEVLATVGGKTYYKDNQVFFDGINEYELSTANGLEQGGDGSQSSHWRDDELRLPSLGTQRQIGIMDPTVAPGTRDTIRINDIRTLEVMGYDVNYFPKFAGVAIKFGSKNLDLDRSQDTINLGDVNLNVSKDVPVELDNLSLDNALEYEIEFIPSTKVPSSTSAALTIASPGGSVNVGQNANVNLTLNGGQTPSVYFGILRFHTNDANRSVIDIPFQFSSGNAVAPTVALSVPKIEDFRFGNSTSSDSLSQEITISNSGTLDLEYNLITSLSTTSSNPTGQPSLAKSVKDEPVKNNLYRFYNPKSITDNIIYSCNFENGISGFTSTGVNAQDWQQTTKGRAAMDGHSKPTAAYFGFDYGDSLRYKSNSNAMFISPPIDVSTVPTQDLITLSFNYYLDAETNFDFAYVLVSTDNGSTYRQIATSNNGILQQNTTSWQSVLIQIPFLSGNTNPIRIAFKFVSDTYVNKEGWYIDDIQLSSIQNKNSLYTTVRGGILPPSGSSTFSLIAKKGDLQSGYYAASLAVRSNDPRHSLLNFPFFVANLQSNSGSPNVIYGITYHMSGKLLQINSSDGSAAELGSAGLDAVKSLTINPVTLQMFALNILPDTSKIISIDGKNGSGLLYVIPDKLLDAIAFDKSGTLYAAGDDMNLYTVNLQSGATTLVKKLGFNAAAMTFNPVSGELWASVDASSDKDRLYKLNIASGDTVLVGRTGLGKTTRGLVFGPNNNLYGVMGDFIQQSTFISIDPQTAAATQIGSVKEQAVFGLTMKIDTAASVTKQDDIVPDKFQLSQNYPNPFNPSTIINYSIPENSHVTLKVYNILGQQIATLVDKEQSAGNYSVDFNAGNLSTGIYLYELHANNFVLVKKMMLTK